jgi:transcriptional regulator with XRE-family HTH domain
MRPTGLECLPVPLTRRAARLLQALKQRRKELGLTMETVGLQVGLRKQNISELEAGKRTPTLGTLLRLTQALDLEICFVRAANIRIFTKAGFHKVKGRHRGERSAA